MPACTSNVVFYFNTFLPIKEEYFCISTKYFCERRRAPQRPQRHTQEEQQHIGQNISRAAHAGAEKQPIERAAEARAGQVVKTDLPARHCHREPKGLRKTDGREQKVTQDRQKTQPGAPAEQPHRVVQQTERQPHGQRK
jgi:hypothetical protein